MEYNGIVLPKYSVLMSVYAGEKVEYFRESVDSMLNQTYPTDDFILVCDGPLTEELDVAVDEYEKKYDFFKALRLKQNVGVGKCANIGIKASKNDYIVKMDSDDIALPERCLLSMYVMAKHKGIDMLGTYIDEFESDSGKFISTKKTPLTNKQIRAYSKRRNPFNNQSLVYKKSLAQKIGGYSDIKRCEDYDFVVRMLAEGAVGINIDRTLVKYRVTAGNYERRRNWKNTKSFIAVRFRIYKMGYSGLLDFILPCLMQMFIFILPKSLTGTVYKKFLRS